MNETPQTTSFEDFYSAEFPRVYRAVALTLRDPEEARDVCQEAFERAYARWPRLAKESWVGGWVMTTAINLCRRVERRRKLSSILPPWRDRSAEAEISPDRLDLLSALEELPFRQRQAMLLHYLGDLPIPVVAELMGLTEGAVKAHLSQAKKKLRVEMGVFNAG